MKYLSTLFLILLLRSAFAQELSFTTAVIHVGTNTINKNPIVATQLTFPYNVYKYDIDTAKNKLFIALRKIKGIDVKNNGYLALIDLSTRKINWSKQLTAFNITATDDLYQLSSTENVSCYKKENDSLIWQKKGELNYVVPEKYIAYNNGKLIGIDKQDGTEKWTRKIDLKYGIEDLQYLNDLIYTVLCAKA